MKPALIGLGSVVLLASATPIPSGSPSSLAPGSNDLTLGKRVELDPTSLETLPGNALEKRANRRMNIPNHAGTAIQNIGAVIVKAIVDAAGDLIFQITNNGGGNAKVSLREVDMGLDAANLNIAAHHTINYDPLGAINPGDTISINFQT
ncbi:hypothetical protein F25303_13710 [Fusarium sp. NRRL 25303]|uniref:Uncharacterized protein n=1 Tax=Fusarium mangiferae TaxID=192010 RepID=A0A1L7TIE6_FUSMA|nr:uncharacterized protein FMAN_10943 [Fusarium mangiferae]KAF5615722.1 hypothetical protein F25303_13710 [Fusarium sp. NRRL 25303]CVK96612.1 uncharacterized protein FMAN_10943 [Fusarium mangiferae]